MENLSTKIHLNTEIDRIVFLCSQISQLVQTIENVQKENISFYKENIELHREEILSTIEQVDGAVLLLESLLHSQERYLKPRLFYDRETLLKLRQSVSMKLSNEKRKMLQDVVNYEIETMIWAKQKWKNHLQSILL